MFSFILKYILIIYIIFVVYKINIELSRGVNEGFFLHSIWVSRPSVQLTVFQLFIWMFGKMEKISLSKSNFHSCAVLS